MQLINYLTRIALIGAFFTNSIYAQNPSENTAPLYNSGGTGKISGTIVDSTTNTPVEFAMVSLVDNKTNKPIDGTICDDKGKFTLNKVKAGDYKIIVTFMDYKTVTINPVKIAEKESVDLKTISMSTSAKALQEVTVEGKKALIEEKVDRLVYNAEADENNKGGDASDVLRKVPMLAVDMDGNVSLRGSQNIKVLINNKPSTISAGSVADALKQIPSDQIKSVEVITSPSARYDAEGSSGIINIITKKNTLQGFNLGVDASTGIRGSSLGVNGSYRKGKMGFTLGGNGRAGYNVTGAYLNKQQTINTSGVEVLNVQKAYTLNERLFGNYSLGWDYDITKSNSLTSSVKYSLRDGNAYQTHLFTQNYVDDTLQSSNTRNTDAVSLSGTLDMNLNYIHTFKKPQHEFSLLGLYSRTNLTSDFNNSILDSIDLSTISSRIKNQNKSFNQEITIQADYQRPLWKGHLVEIGAKNITRKVISDYQYYTANGSEGAFVASSNAALNNSLNYNQN
ncbi:MAG TPA: TonB-dependent receptor, partial [Cytophagaceae bacterium]|nr:TonB-dependent receptor [Cytophagaceae bacterium]